MQQCPGETLRRIGEIANLCIAGGTHAGGNTGSVISSIGCYLQKTPQVRLYYDKHRLNKRVNLLQQQHPVGIVGFHSGWISQVSCILRHVMSAAVAATVRAIALADFIVNESRYIALLRAVLHIVGHKLPGGLIPCFPAMVGVDPTREILVAEGKGGVIAAAHVIKCSGTSRRAHYTEAEVVRKSSWNGARARCSGHRGIGSGSVLLTGHLDTGGSNVY